MNLNTIFFSSVLVRMLFFPASLDFSTHRIDDSKALIKIVEKDIVKSNKTFV